MSLILAWVIFPLVLVAVGAGWGALVERAAGLGVGILLVPLGWATVIVVTLLVAKWSVTAPIALPIVGLGTVAGLVIARPWPRRAGWPLLTAVAILLAYGAPVLLSGQATFTGYIKLDDTASILDLIDHAMTNLHEFGGVVQSSYAQVFNGDFGPTYPIGAFMVPAVGHLFTGINSAWIIQPYMACCGAAVGLGVYSLLEGVVDSPRIRALVAFIAAQPALLYGYSLWGGSKEMTAAFLLVLGAALLAAVLVERPASPRRLLPLAIAVAALILTLGVGAVGFIAPGLIAMVIAWARRSPRGERRILVRDLALLSVVTAALALPVWFTVAEYLSRVGGFFTSGTHSAEESLGNLIKPVSGWQLAGIWPVGDFRLTPPTLPSVLLIGLVVIAAAAGLLMTLRRHQIALTTYLAVTLIGCATYYLSGASPWIVGKALAMSSPALLAAALAAGAMLWSMWGSRRAAGVVGILVVLALTGGVLWSNALGYHDVTLAPRARMAELAHIDGLVAGKGPTFVNEYEVYADRAFLHEGEPVEPAEYRPVTLALSDGAVLTKAAGADLDSFPLSTLEPYRSIVTRRSPAESRPPSIYQLVWQGRYYQLWQRPAVPTTRIIEHVPLGESTTRPYCGASQNDAMLSLCSANPVATPSCAAVRSLGRRALAAHARLVAYNRPAPIVVRAEESLWPGGWGNEVASRTVTPTAPGQMVAHIAVASSQVYELFLAGNFARGFQVSIDGRSVGTVKNQLSGFTAYVPVANVYLTAGVHTFVLTYPHADLAPGSGLNEFTSLTAIALQPTSPPSRMLEVAPQQATGLCGLLLDWIEIVAPARGTV